MGITSKRLKELGLVDQIVLEPLGGAHRDLKYMALNLKNALLENLDFLEGMPLDKLLHQRYQRLMNFGNFNEA
jgi:acetyl-CoA carboxylase carboxyl transferase subunit alpha